MIVYTSVYLSEMTFFDQLYQRLFPGKEAENQKIFHEVIQRNPKFLFRYEEWKSSISRLDIINAYHRSYDLKKAGIQNDPNVHVFESAASNGFALTYSNEFSKQDFQYFFDYLAERVKMLGYRLVNSDVLIVQKNNEMETKEKHYLKPPLSSGANNIDQMFGNILVELVLVDDEPSYIKMLANIYSDRLYQRPAEHGKLIEHLFATNS